MIYLDNNATTPIAPEVRETMLPWLGHDDGFGNPSSLCTNGKRARAAIDEARSQVAKLVGATREEIVFTSGGTESNNTAIHSALATQPGKNHIVASAVEHSAVLDFLRLLERRGLATFTLVDVDVDGQLDLDAVSAAIRPETALVSIMTANNETGVVFPVDQIAKVVADKGVPFHTDAVNAAGKIAIDATAFPIHFLSLSGHKFHGIKGIGILFVRSGLQFEPFLVGGGQEGGRRSGTESVPLIAGLGEAARLAREFVDADGSARLSALRDDLQSRLLESIDDLLITTSGARLPNTLHLSVEGVRADELLLLLDDRGLCASAGSACSTGQKEPSHVLTAMGIDAARARSSIRLSLSRYTTEEEIDRAATVMKKCIKRLRGLQFESSPGTQN
ncbi:MAG: cysteine desulfurase family protein [Verrucomicrobiota bacterium]